MFSHELSLSGHTRRFTISTAPAEGWEIRVEEDDRLVRQTHYNDWHRVERALTAVQREVRALQDRGWKMVSGALALDQSTNR
jgi:hypothetical protein